MIQTQTRPRPVTRRSKAVNVARQNPAGKLKALEAAATPGPWLASAVQSFPPWDPCWFSVGSISLDVFQAMADARLIKVSRNLMPELIALWEAAERHREGAASLVEALAMLNAKAAVVFSRVPCEE